MEKKNFYGIKVGDIFYSDTDLKFFVQVVELKGTKQVIVSKIESETYEKLEGGYEFKVRPIKDKFKKDSDINRVVKTVMKKDDDSYDIGKIYLSIETGYKNYRCDYFLYENEELINNYWSIWMR